MHERVIYDFRNVDLRSDTFTKPSEGMLNAMRNALVGDACYGEDPTVNKLQTFAAKYFGKEAALYLFTGTMTNEVAVASILLERGQEMVLADLYHANFFESKQMAGLLGVVLNPCATEDGILTAKKVKEMIDGKCRAEQYAQLKLVLIENTVNSSGGKVFPLNKLKELHEYTSKNGLILYMDGARLLNACAATGIDPKEYAKYVDCLGVCFSKGLGAPMGSVLLGTKEFIKRATNNRKIFGGGFHQGGFMAATGLYALKHNVELLKTDHEHIQLLAYELNKLPGIKVVKPETNMLMFDVSELGVNAEQFVALAKQRGVLLIAWQKNIVRIVTHLDVSHDDVIRAGKILSELVQELNLPAEERKVVDPKISVNVLIDALKSRNINYEYSPTKPQSIQIKVKDKAVPFVNEAKNHGVYMHIATKSKAELFVTGEYSKAELNEVVDRLAGVYQSTLRKEVAVPTCTRSAFNSNAHFKYQPQDAMDTPLSTSNTAARASTPTYRSTG